VLNVPASWVALDLRWAEIFSAMLLCDSGCRVYKMVEIGIGIGGSGIGVDARGIGRRGVEEWGGVGGGVEVESE
jgi:hypothetical protein